MHVQCAMQCTAIHFGKQRMTSRTVHGLAHVRTWAGNVHGLKHCISLFSTHFNPLNSRFPALRSKFANLSKHECEWSVNLFFNIGQSFFRSPNEPPPPPERRVIGRNLCLSSSSSSSRPGVDLLRLL